MKATFKALLFTTALAIASTAFTQTVRAADEKKDKPAEEGKKVDRAVPFSGKISALDAPAKTFTIPKNRVIQVTDKTKILKDGKAATLADAKVGDEVGGSYHKLADGKLEAASLRIGPKPEGKDDGKKKDEKKEEKK